LVENQLYRFFVDPEQHSQIERSRQKTAEITKWLLTFDARRLWWQSGTAQSFNACRPHLGERLTVWGQRRRLTSHYRSFIRTMFGERAFSHAGPAAWNSMPEHIRAEPEIRIFVGNCWRHVYL